MGARAAFELSPAGRVQLCKLLGQDGAPTQGQVARYVGCSRQFISDLVLGKKTGCSEDIAYGIERCLKAQAGSLFVPRNSPVETLLVSQQDTERPAVPA
jgi:hypothetical protein